MPPIIKYFVAVVLVACSLSVRAQTAVELMVGDTHILTLEQVTDIVLGDEGIAQVQLLDNKTLVVKALSAGSTELIIRQASGTTQRFELQINAHPNRAERSQLKWLKQHMPTLSITEADGVVLLAGELSANDHKLLLQHADRNPDWLLQITEAAPSIEQMIELHVKIMEVKRQQARHIGVSWPGTYQGPQVSNAGGQWVTFPVAMQSTIHLLEQNGSAQVLAEPKLVAASGGQAEFLVGGEFPIPQVVAQGLQDVEFREYGITLTMSPKDMGQGQISTAIKAEISTIDPATTVNGIPGMLTRRVSSMITATSGESIVLSGLISQEQSRQAELFPYLHKLPILGHLFSSQQFRDAETELLVVVTPRLKVDIQQQHARHNVAQKNIKNFRQQATCVGLIDVY